MNLNCNYMKSKFIEPKLSIYVQVQNLVDNCYMFFTLKYFYEGSWYTKTSKMISCNKRGRLYFEKSSSSREISIFKRVDTKDTFIYNTIITSDNPTCFEVIGTNMHTFINKVQC